MRIRITYVATLIIAVLLVCIGHVFAMRGFHIFYDESRELASARVISITERLAPGDRLEGLHFPDYSDEYSDDDPEGFDGFVPIMGEQILFEAQISSGPRRGETIIASQSLGRFLVTGAREVKAGDSVLLIRFDFNPNEWHFNGYIRTGALITLALLFVLCVILFGGKKGFNTILSLGLTCAAVFAVFIPSILSGKNIYIMAMLICAYTTIMTLLLVMGYNRKSFAAAISCLSGIIIAGIITLIMDRILLLTGIVDDQSRYLISLPVGADINLKAIIFAGIIIGAMGAIMDVAMSIASAIWEIKEKAREVNFKTLFRSGINIGRDIMGSMANTLILAYIGSSLSAVLLLTVYSGSLLELFNREMIAVEVLQALAGSFGILSALPLTAFFCAKLYLRKHN